MQELRKPHTQWVCFI